MSSESSNQDAVVCKPTKWFLWRALAMLTMFTVFAVLFFKDGMWGYREKNLHFYVHKAFVIAGSSFQSMQNEGELTEATWEKFASQQKVPLPDGMDEVLPRGTDTDMPWPDTITDGFSVMDEKGGQTGAAQLWEKFTASRKEVEGKAWDIDPGEKPFKAGKIREQFIAMSVTLLLMAITLFFLIRTMRRKIVADNEALYTQDGKKVLYSEMVRVDKRKWDNKGLALVYYNQGGEEKKAKVDGMVYGQFREEDGAPAEKLFSKIIENFKGEIVEYVSVDDENEDESDDTTAEAPKSDDE